MSHTDPGVDFADIHFDVTSATALQGGGYARVWYTGSGTTTQLYGQVFDSSLNLYKGTFTVSVADGQLDTEPEIYALSDGGFFVSWSSNEVLYGARYDVRGEAEVAPFRISDSGSHPSIAELEGGDIAVVWETRPDIRPSTDIVGAILDADGNRLETISNITEETESWQREASIAPLDGGGFVVTWETDGDPDSITNIDYDVEFRIFDENGTPTTGALTVAAHSGSNQMDPDVATLNNGDFVIVWGAESSNSTVEKIYGRIFDSSGAASSTQFVIDGPQDTSSDQVLPSVAALNDGGFYVSWGSHTHNLYGQRFDENGATVGDYTTIASVSSEQHYNSDVSVSGDGRVFISWQYYSSDNSSFGMNVEILTLPVDINTLEGTEAADTLIGSSGVDRIDGAGGNDNLKGLGANDVIYGGDGADYITGGDGNDLVATGAGDDTVFAGGDGNDTIRGDSGNDTLGGGNGSDLIIGGGTSSYFDSDTSTEDGSDVLYGGTGADILIGGNWLDADGDDYMDLQELLEPTGSDPNTLWGGDGDDFMFGALGNDTFGGGSGDDVMMGLDGNDVIYGGRGDSAISNDTMDGGAGQDQLFAGDGNDSVDGGSDNDVLYSGAGNDFVGGGSGNDSLWGGSGNDVLNSGAGADDIFGGSGADKFVFSSGHGQDIIRDFSLDDDSLDLRSTDTDFSSAADVKTAADQATVDDESGVLIDTGDGNSIFIVGLSINDLASVNLTF